jgi:hypothetical protein
LAVGTVAGEVGLYFTLVALTVAAHFVFVANLVGRRLRRAAVAEDGLGRDSSPTTSPV